ncbi:hypothetical protein [Flavobacterium limnosediminis]|uniref:hypothetical protein n=1 Tax=Flavobacterium limnosediminis TaxID=1401027 RepID=UPI0004177FC1|nr:hypothetical protein [Flavobacterium limnosediminis]
MIIRTFALPYLKKWWNDYTDKKANEAYSKKEQELLDQGNQEFHFEKGRVRVFAKSLEQAKAQYNDMKHKLKKASR